MEKNQQKGNPLGFLPITPLIIKFAVPSIIAMLVSAVYNIVDQLFIGQAVGTLGNAATNIAFPLAMMCTAIALLFGIGGASNFNLKLGAGQKEEAGYFLGNALTCLVILGIILALVTEICLYPMLKGFGSPDDVLPYAMDYVRITAIGFPFLILTIGGGHLMRADGSPKMTMFCSMSGAIINVVLDALFVLVLRWGMSGAALATIIGQIFSGLIVVNYMRHTKTVELKVIHLMPNPAYVFRIASLGCASCFNQLAMMTTQIVLNNSLKHYGALSVYGESIPIACAGIVMKVNQLFFSIVIGLSQSTQPIESFNYGARQYDRVKEAYRKAMIAAFCVSLFSFILFQTIPRTIMGLFGEGSEEYFTFGVSYFKVFLFFTWLNCLQPLTSTFFTSIGKAFKGVFLSLTRQMLFLLPMILILPMIFGIDGILYAAPIADLAAAITAVILAYYEFRNINRLAKEVA